jgi:hypothetical protein
MEEFHAGSLLAEFFAVDALIQSVIATNSQAKRRDEVITALKRLNEKCIQSSLGFSGMAIEQFIGAIQNGTDPIAYDAREMAVVRGRIIDELTRSTFMQISPLKMQFYALPDELFGQITTSRFNKAGPDIEEAGKCFATGRNTACVFHLMRVMEIGVQKLGQRLHVKLVGEKAWQTILNQINSKIGALPQSTPRQRKRKSDLAGITSHLYNVKIAWRNEVMHPKESYSDVEAEEIFRHVKSFMRHLAEKL